MDIDLFRSLVGLLVMVLFILIWISAWSRSRKVEYEEAAQIPLEDDSEGDSHV